MFKIHYSEEALADQKIAAYPGQKQVIDADAAVPGRAVRQAGNAVVQREGRRGSQRAHCPDPGAKTAVLPVAAKQFAQACAAHALTFS